MLTSRRSSSILGVALLSLLAAGAPAATPALAGAPATVTVRVLGPAPGYAALTPLTQVTTTIAQVTQGGGSCSGTSAAGALELATKGEWEGVWSSEYGDYEVVSIDKLSYPFAAGAPYWNFWLNNRYEEVGVCHAELEAGDQVLFFPECYSAEECPSTSSVLGIEAPATAEAGKPFTVTVDSYNAKGERSPLAGAAVGDGETSAETNAGGQAQLTFSRGGTYTLRATDEAAGAAPPVPGEALVCAHEGEDGTCGTTASSRSSGIPLTLPITNVSQGPATGPYALVAAATGVTEGHRYTRRGAPRVLSGKVIAHAAVTSISLRLRRAYRGRCWAYSGASERFVRARCGAGRFFQIASGGDSFSYLLPSRLPPGRYVLDLQATDASGNRTALARGSSRIVFYVE